MTRPSSPLSAVPLSAPPARLLRRLPESSAALLGLVMGLCACQEAPPPESLACALSPTPDPSPTPQPEACASRDCQSAVRINELMASNDGAWVDERGQTDDWIELYNPLDVPVSAQGMGITDGSLEAYILPELRIPARGVLLLWADNSLDEGPQHLPFKLSQSGEEVTLLSVDGSPLDVMPYPALNPNHSWQRLPDGEGEPVDCAFATPARANGSTCGPPAPAGIADTAQFCPFTWPEPFPALLGPLVINELRLESGGYVELLNVGPGSVSLQGYQLRLGTMTPGSTWPGTSAGIELPLPETRLSAGDMLIVPLSDEALAESQRQPQQDSVLSLFSRETGEVQNRLEIMSWVEGASLARVPDGTGAARFCQMGSPGASNEDCTPITTRETGTWLRALQTPGDFDRFGAGDSYTGTDEVKVIVDLKAGNQVYFLDSTAWDLHYTFVREVIEGQEHLDRCDPEEAAIFNAGWSAFSQENYYSTEDRHYLLGTLIRYGANDLHTVEIHPADEMLPEQEKLYFFEVLSHVLEPTRWVMRAADENQVAKLHALAGAVPAVGPNAAFEGMTYQPLNEGYTYGLLQFIPSSVLETTAINSQTIVVTDAVPLDIDLVAGLITETFQTPLSHVGVLSKNRGTPNMALVDAHLDEAIAPFLGKLVRLDVGSGDFLVREAAPEEANAFWEAQAGEFETIVPEIDLTMRGVQRVEGLGLENLPAIGAKAAQLGELKRLAVSRGSEVPVLNTPRDAFVIPVVYSIEHFEASGAAELLTTLQEDPAFQADPTARAAGLEQVRNTILQHPIDPALLGEVEAFVQDYFGDEEIRLRSSSNTEDIPGFSGAGLYTSTSAALLDDTQSIEQGIKVVWASLWNARAYDERTYFHVAQDGIGMGVLGHQAFHDEQANGVSISRNILDPTRSSYYTNVQRGEASVTNPAPGITSDELLYRWGESPPERYLAYSSFRVDGPVLSGSQLDDLNLVLKDIHNYFKGLLDPTSENAYFAMDIEFKFLDDGGELLVKQARPYSYGRGVTDDCE